MYHVKFRSERPFLRPAKFVFAMVVLIATMLLGLLPTAAQKDSWLYAEDISTMPPTSIRYWFYESPERTALGEQQLQQFQELFPNITVEGRQAPQAVDNAQLLAFIRTGTNSHIHQSFYKEDVWYIENDILMPLEGLPGFDELRARLPDNMNYVWKDGHVYSLSWYYGGVALCYNSDLVIEAGLDPVNPPATYSEFLTWAQALTQDKNGDGTTDQWFIAPPLGEEWWWWSLAFSPFYIAATGSGAVLDADGNPMFNNPQGIKPYELMQTLFSEGYATTSTEAESPFVNGIVAAEYPCWMGSHRGLQDTAPEDFEYITGPIPRPDDAEFEGNPNFLFVRNLALVQERDKTGEEADRIMRASWEFMKFLLSEEQMAADFAVSAEPPATSDLLTNPVYEPTIASLGDHFRWQVDYVLREGVLGDMSSGKIVEMESFLQRAYLNVAYGRLSAADAVAQAEQDVINLLSQ